MINKDTNAMVESLKRIEKKLDLLASFAKLAVHKPKVGKEEAKVLILCDRKHSAKEIAEKIGKTENNVNVILTHLKDKNLIESLEIDDKTAYQRIW